MTSMLMGGRRAGHKWGGVCEGGCCNTKNQMRAVRKSSKQAEKRAWQKDQK